MNLHDKHMKLIDAVNFAKTEQEHQNNDLILHGWRQGVSDAGFVVDLIGADLEQFDRGFEYRDMCCGVFCDWKPPETL